MIPTIVVATVWALGSAGWLFILRGSPVTWIRLAGALAFGWAFPILIPVLGAVILANADFWRQPIFTQDPPESEGKE